MGGEGLSLSCAPSTSQQEAVAYQYLLGVEEKTYLVMDLPSINTVLLSKWYRSLQAPCLNIPSASGNNCPDYPEMILGVQVVSPVMLVQI